MNNSIRTLIIRFDAEIASKEIPFFRGAVIHALDNKLILFHNHEGEKYRYSYPLIQYKRIKGKAAIVCLNQGVDDIGELFVSQISEIRLGERGIKMNVEKVFPQNFTVQVWDQMFLYRINRWIPFNSENFKKYQQIESMSESIVFLEKLLVGNILSFAKGVGVILDKKVDCTITDLSSSHINIVKGVKMMSYDILFKTNISLPDYIGLGKHASMNFGVVTKVKDKEE